MEVYEFASARGIDSEPDFVWWVPFSLRKRDRVISAVNARKKTVSHNYGVQLPSTAQEAFDIYM